MTTVFTPTGAGGIPIPAIQPQGAGVDGAPLSVGATAVTTASKVGAGAVYVVASVPVFVRLDGLPATNESAYLPPNVPMVFACDNSARPSFLAAGEAGTVYVHAVRSA